MSVLEVGCKMKEGKDTTSNFLPEQLFLSFLVDEGDGLPPNVIGAIRSGQQTLIDSFQSNRKCRKIFVQSSTLIPRSIVAPIPICQAQPLNVSAFAPSCSNRDIGGRFNGLMSLVANQFSLKESEEVFQQKYRMVTVIILTSDFSYEVEELERVRDLLWATEDLLSETNSPALFLGIAYSAKNSAENQDILKKVGVGKDNIFSAQTAVGLREVFRQLTTLVRRYY